MIRMNIKFDTKQVKRFLSDLEKKQIPFATAQALTRLAEAGKEAITNELEHKLDRPKPFTTKAVYTQRALKTRLYSVVGLKDRQAGYLEALLQGGQRKLKRNEQRFLGRPIVPGPDVRLDRFGNVPRAMLIRILKAAQAQKKVMPDGRFVFITKDGVFARKPRSRQIQTLLLFADKQPSYAKRLDPERAVGKVVQRRAQAEFNRAFAEALRTAR